MNQGAKEFNLSNDFENCERDHEETSHRNYSFIHSFRIPHPRRLKQSRTTTDRYVYFEFLFQILVLPPVIG
jgi:hypothetical protein